MIPGLQICHDSPVAQKDRREKQSSHILYIELSRDVKQIGYSHFETSVHKDPTEHFC